LRAALCGYGGRMFDTAGLERLEAHCLHLEPQLTDPLLAVRVGVTTRGPSVPLWLDLPLPPGVSETAAVTLCCLGA
jgi:hypothetical protein